MKTVSARSARLFSSALGKLYISKSLEALDQAADSAVRLLFPAFTESEHEMWVQHLCSGAGADQPPCERPFLIELLLPHMVRCRGRFMGQVQALPSIPTPVQASVALRGLTPRERQVLQRIALGETDAEVGRALEISTKTVGKHVEHILHKLGVETRTAAVVSIHSQNW